MSKSQDRQDENLIVVVTTEEYARRHGIPAHGAAVLLRDSGMLDLVRSQYDVLHTLDLDEGASFVEEALGACSYG